MGTIKDRGYYDAAYSASKEYKKHYSESIYFGLWESVYSLISSVPILEVGCGPGQFAQMLQDRGVIDYFGFDYSRTAIEIAKDKSDQKFSVMDALTPDPYSRDFECAIIMEVLEHTDDLKILSFIKSGKEVIITVPDFDYPSHVRFFETKEQVTERYGGLIDIMHYEKFDKWHIAKGIKI